MGQEYLHLPLWAFIKENKKYTGKKKKIAKKWILTTENLKGSIKTQDHLITKTLMAKNSNGIAISLFSKTQMYLPLFWLFT